MGALANVAEGRAGLAGCAIEEARRGVGLLAAIAGDHGFLCRLIGRLEFVSEFVSEFASPQ